LDNIVIEIRDLLIKYIRNEKPTEATDAEESYQ